ncbi:MAG: NUDIX domain-containing protein [Alphaproteobacteria bacterium]|nr:MAG: NUDIX domain-containing protein [Alphaproteobacteria bacterium]
MRRLSLDATRRALEPVLRRVLHAYWRFARAMTLGVRALVIDEEGRVFLVKHSYVSGWHLPGGGVEAGETISEALARELQEEGNIEMTAPPQLHGLFFNDRDSRRDHVALFIVRAFRQLAAPVPGREIVGHGFFALDALPNDTTAATRARIIEVLGGAPVSERWPPRRC